MTATKVTSSVSMQMRSHPCAQTTLRRWKMSQNINDLIRASVLHRTRNGTLQWFHANGVYSAKIDDIAFQLIDNRGTCERCCESVAECICDEGAVPDNVYFVVEYNTKFSAHNPTNDSIYGHESLGELADLIKGIAKKPAVRFYKNSTEVLQSLILDYPKVEKA